eukprot:CCRYP_004468-RA/>CCRYP_004468-RA protein AED:0.11 eAED:0.11 QI:403/0.75/0.8/1/0.5/0.4/5/185/622
MIPFRMTDGGDHEAPLEEHRFIDDNYRAHQMQRPPHAVSYEEDALRDRLEEPTASNVDGASGTAGEPVLLQRDEGRPAFTGDSHQQSQDCQRQDDRDRNYSSNMSPMPIHVMPSAAAPAADGSATAASQKNPQFEQGTPRHPHYPRSHQDHVNTPVNPIAYPPQHHYRFHPQQQHPYPYDYSGYYHPHSSEVDIAGVSPYHHLLWQQEQPHGFQNYSSPYQDYSYYSYYSSSSPASYPPVHPPPRHAQQYPEDPYSASNQVPSRSRHPHSAPPSYHRSTAHAASLRTTPPLPSTRETKHPTSQHYKETPSAITEGTTPSKQSPSLELSPEMSALFDESGSEHEEDRKPAAKTEADSQTKIYQSRQEHGESNYMGAMNEQSSPRNDDFEPIPFWSDLPRDAVSSSNISRYRIYPPAASVHPEEYSPPYSLDPQQHGLAPQHRYPSTPTRSAAVATGSSRQDSMASTLSSGGEGSSWEKRFAELLEFRAKFGHCEVPQNYKDNTSLGIWVNKQRMEQKNRMEGKNSSLNDLRMQRLESVGFRWAKRKGQVSWNEKFEELKAYKKKHGNQCHVPTKYKANTALGRWVSTQRAEYKKFCEGDEKSSMTTEKIRRLEEIGFAWFMAL